MKTSWILPLSLALNVALVAFTALNLHQDAVGNVGRLEAAAPTSAAPKVPILLPTAPAPEVHSLRWSDLVSSDDAIYAANLRAIGCPEATIRNIIAAAISDRYELQRQDLVAQHEQGKIDRATMEAAVAQTWERQNESINRLPVADPAGTVGTSAAPMSGAVAPVYGAAAPAYGGAPAVTGTLPGGGTGLMIGGPLGKPIVAVPLAVTDPPASLTPAQADAAQRVADNFANAVGSQNLAPTDPAYHQLWRQQQILADDALKAQIGAPAFVQWQIQAARTAVQTQNAPK